MSTGYLIGNWSRFYIVDENNRSVAKTEVSGSEQECTDKIRSLRKGVPPPEIVTMIREAGPLVDALVVEDEVLAKNLQGTTGYDVSASHSDMFRRFRLMFFKKGIHNRHPLALSTAREDKKEADAHPDMRIQRLVDMLTMYDESYQFYQNFRETWYEIRFTDRETPIIQPNLVQEESLVRDIHDLLEVISALQKRTRKALASILKEYAPTLFKVAGPVIAAQLIAEAGSLERLATLSAGTIQILGARKAFFRAKHSGSPLPKFGIIFSHPYIQKLPSRHRGKMARFLSCQIAIASRADMFTQRDISGQLRIKLKKRFHQLGGLP
jgi:RNA processing factor Prp31